MNQEYMSALLKSMSESTGIKLCKDMQFLCLSGKSKSYLVTGYNALVANEVVVHQGDVGNSCYISFRLHDSS